MRNISTLPRPQDRAAAVLTKLVATFNAGASDRSAITCGDFTALVDVEAKASAYVDDVRSETRHIPTYEAIDQTCASVIELVERYRSLSEGSETRSVAGHEYSLPAIESTALRARVVELGHELISAIETVEKLRVSALDNHSKNLRAEEDELLSMMSGRSDIATLVDLLVKFTTEAEARWAARRAADSDAALITIDDESVIDLSEALNKRLRYHGLSTVWVPHIIEVARRLRTTTRAAA